MRNATLFAAAGAAVLLATPVARAADLPLAVHVPQIEEYSGWYLRGDIGISNQRVKSLDNAGVGPGTTVSTQFLTFDSAPFFGAGVGYQFNNWLRVDVTGEYRASAHFHGQQVASVPGIILPDDYNASKSEWTFLTNAYIDLGTWCGITPLIGAGIGASYNQIASFTDIGATQAFGNTILATTYGGDAWKLNFAWAAYAGLSYQVNQRFSVEMAYRYLNLGQATTGPTNSFDGVTIVNGTPFQFKDLTSQDIKLGIRMNLGEPLAPAPLMRKG